MRSGIKRYHFAPVGKKLLDRLKSFLCMRLQRADGPESWGARDAGRAVAVLAHGRALAGVVTASHSPNACDLVWSERLRSRNPCGVRARDEFTKRTRPRRDLTKMGRFCPRIQVASRAGRFRDPAASTRGRRSPGSNARSGRRGTALNSRRNDGRARRSRC